MNIRSLTSTELEAFAQVHYLQKRDIDLLIELSTCNGELLKKLADIIHDSHCFENHTDGCGYYYGAWEWKGEGYNIHNVTEYAKERILNYGKAKKLFKSCKYQAIRDYLMVRRKILAREDKL